MVDAWATTQHNSHYLIPHSPPSLPQNSHNSTSSLTFCLQISHHFSSLLPPYPTLFTFFIFRYISQQQWLLFPSFFSLFFFCLLCFLSFWRLFSFFTSFFPPWCVMRFLVMGILSWLLKSLKTWSFSCWLFWVSSIFCWMCYLVSVCVRSNGSVFAVTVPLPRKVVGWWGWLQPRQKDLAHVRDFCFQNWIPYNVVRVFLRKTMILSTLFSKKKIFFFFENSFHLSFLKGLVILPVVIKLDCWFEQLFTEFVLEWLELYYDQYFSAFVCLFMEVLLHEAEDHFVCTA